MYSETQRRTLLEVAKASIRHGLAHGEALQPELSAYDALLREERACFVTLQRNGALRGCIGALQAYQPLVTDVARHAYEAAFSDPRFPPLIAAELTDLELHISVLSHAEAMSFNSEAQLLEQVRPGTDGLILEEGFYRGTFLPSVWEQLPEKREFLRHLKMKAGLMPDHWSDKVKVSRYTTESFGTTIR